MIKLLKFVWSKISRGNKGLTSRPVESRQTQIERMVYNMERNLPWN